MYRFITRYGTDEGDTVDYSAGVGHNAAVMMSNTAGVTRLVYVLPFSSVTHIYNSFFSLDNFSGDGSRKADFGTRQITGDHPHPVE